MDDLNPTDVIQAWRESDAPAYAVLGCQAYKDWLENGNEDDHYSETLPFDIGDSCSCNHVADLPVLWEELPCCPYCSGPSFLVEPLVSAAV